MVGEKPRPSGSALTLGGLKCQARPTRHATDRRAALFWRGARDHGSQTSTVEATGFVHEVKWAFEPYRRLFRG
jgi:hypothetical protein